MEKRINKKISIHMTVFKSKLIQQLKAHNIDINPSNNGNAYDLVSFIYNYPTIEILKEDLIKRKRVKNTVPLCYRCCALRANGEQCSRRKKDNEKFCGTHIKGIPHGEISNKPIKPTHRKVQCWIQEIQGISYYIDGEGNVYNHEDIVNNNVNPNIIAKYKYENMKYSIPAFFKS
jgi:hypothetical protein